MRLRPDRDRFTPVPQEANAGEIDPVVTTPAATRTPPAATGVRFAASAVLIFVASRAVQVIAALAATWVEPTLKLHQTLVAWDGGWFLRIAQAGYPAFVHSEGGGNRWAFFPLFPEAMRAIHWVAGVSYVDAGAMAGFLFGATAAWATGAAVRAVAGDAVALRCVALQCFFPAAYVLGITYSEGLFITCAAACLLFLVRRRWLLAAVFASLGCLTRNAGVFLVAAVLVHALQVAVADRRVTKTMAAAVALSPAGFVAWCLYGYHRTGHILAFLSAEKAWDGSHFVWFLTPFRSAWSLATHASSWRNGPAVLDGLTVAFLASAVVALVVTRAWRKLPWSWWLYLAGVALTALSPFWPGPSLRYSLVAFPAFIGFASARRVWVSEALIGGWGLLQGALAVVVFAGLVNGHPSFSP